jgi:DNA-binding GntR family transcriptional regulator
MTARPAKPLRDVIADDLREQIIRGTLRPGQRVREDEVADAHGVSRVPAREAVQRLANEGYLELVPFRGAVVVSPSPGRSLELMQVRRALESMAARLAAERRGGSVANELTRLVRRGNRAAKSHAHRVLPMLINQFHELVALASGNEELIELLGQVRDKVRWMFEVDLPERSQDSWTDHALILEAILAGAAETAAERMDVHVAKDELLYRDKYQMG